MTKQQSGVKREGMRASVSRVAEGKAGREGARQTGEWIIETYLGNVAIVAKVLADIPLHTLVLGDGVAALLFLLVVEPFLEVAEARLHVLTEVRHRRQISRNTPLTRALVLKGSGVKKAC